MTYQLQRSAEDGGDREPPRWLSAREERAWRALQFLHLRVDGELARRLAAETDLSYAEYVVLVALTDHDDGRLRSFELGATLGWEKSRVSHQVRRMETRGLVAREPCADDGRGAYVVVTDTGRRSIETAAPSHVAAVRSLFVDHLTSDQLEQITEICEQVLTALAVRFDG
jgi:DNA-binding MarR family transcriptional regulator